MGILEKLTTRNTLAIGTGATFLGIIAYIITQAPELVENPIVTGFLGAFTTLTTLVYQFYFRRANPEE